MTCAVVYEPQDALLAWAAERTPTGAPYRDDARAIGLASSDGALHVVTVFDTFTPWDCQVHICASSRHWMDRNYIRACAAFIFIQCGLSRAAAQISRTNREALALARWVGFRREGIARGAGMQAEGMVLLGMTRAECCWLPRSLGPSPFAPRQTTARAL